MMKEPLARVPRWYRMVRAMEERMGVTGSWDLFLEREREDEGLSCDETQVTSCSSHLVK